MEITEAPESPSWRQSVSENLRRDDSGCTIPSKFASAVGTNNYAFFAWLRREGIFHQVEHEGIKQKNLPVPEQIEYGHFLLEKRTKPGKGEYTQVVITPKGIEYLLDRYEPASEAKPSLASTPVPDEQDAIVITMLDGSVCYGIPVSAAEARRFLGFSYQNYFVLLDDNGRIFAVSHAQVKLVHPPALRKLSISVDPDDPAFAAAP
jgi:hypothetical protein